MLYVENRFFFIARDVQHDKGVHPPGIYGYIPLISQRWLSSLNASVTKKYPFHQCTFISQTHSKREWIYQL